VLKSEGTQKDLITLGEMVNEYEVTQVIVGLPINMDGTESKQTQKIRDFTQKLSNRLNVSVFFVDERLTSRQAERMMSESGVTSKKQRGKVDQIAAAILLQAALKGAPLTEVPRT
jgi:putative Holliday junction resolvase